MSNNSNLNDIDDGLLDRYLSGEVKQSESDHVERWLNEHDEMNDVLAQIAAGKMLESRDLDYKDMPRMMLDDWNKVKGLTTSSNANSLNGAQNISSAGQGRLSVTKDGSLVTSDGSYQDRNTLSQTQNSPSRKWLSNSAALAVMLVVGLVAGWAGVHIFELTGVGLEQSSARTFVTGAGERATVNLGDGSYVMLGPASTLSISSDFNKTSRAVTLVGNGFFSVATQSGNPFTVKAGNAYLKVLGTSFSVRAYSDEDDVTVVVKDGRVSVADSARAISSNDVPALVASENDIVKINRATTTISRERVDAANLLAWTEGRLVFKDAPLKNVLREISRWHDVEFRVIDPSVNSIPITGEFSNESLDELPASLGFILPVRVSQSGRIFTITSK